MRDDDLRAALTAVLDAIDGSNTDHSPRELRLTATIRAVLAAAAGTSGDRAVLTAAADTMHVLYDLDGVSDGWDRSVRFGLRVGGYAGWGDHTEVIIGAHGTERDRARIDQAAVWHRARGADPVQVLQREHLDGPWTVAEQPEVEEVSRGRPKNHERRD
jgi:hypothetical protein